MPKGVELVYWDYYHHDEGSTTSSLRATASLALSPSSPGVSEWISHTVNWSKTFVTTNAAQCLQTRRSKRSLPPYGAITAPNVTSTPPWVCNFC